MASRCVWCIFQLPAINGFRALTAWPSVRLASDDSRRLTSSPSPQGLEARQVTQFEQLERRAAAGAHVVDAIGEPELPHCGRAVAAAHDGEAVRLGDGFGH